MKRKRLAGTGLEVSRLGLALDPQVCDGDAVERLFGRASDLGINLVQTGRDTGTGEVLIGKALGPRREAWIVCSGSDGHARQRVAQDVDDSLRALDTDYIDIYMCYALSRRRHLEQVLGDDGAVAALQAAREAGKVRYLGFRSFVGDTALSAIESRAFDVCMTPVNMFELDFLRDVVPMARRYRVGVIGCRPLVGGLFPHPQIALPFAFAQPAEVIVAATSTVPELETYAGIARSYRHMASTRVRAMEDEATELGYDMCRQCQSCGPCAVEIDISTILRCYRDARRFSLADVAAEEYGALSVKADQCIECGVCEELCAFGVPVIDRLYEAHGLLRSSA